MYLCFWTHTASSLFLWYSFTALWTPNQAIKRFWREWSG